MRSEDRRTGHLSFAGRYACCRSLWLGILILLLAAAGGVKAQAAGQTIAFSSKTKTTWVSGTVDLKADVMPAAMRKRNLSFKSSNPRVASVDRNGKVTGRAVGQTVITVKAAGQKTAASCRISVRPYRPVQSIRFRTGSVTLTAGKTFKQMPAFTPDNASDKRIRRWTSTNSSVVSVDRFGSLTARKPGTARIQAVTTDHARNAWYTVRVTAAPRKSTCIGTKLFRMQKPKISGTSCSMQDSYIEGGTYIQFWTPGIVQFYNLRTGRLLSEYALGNGYNHCAVASPGAKKGGSQYADMYLESNRNGIVYVDRLVMGRIRTVEKLKFPTNGAAGYNVKHVVDAGSNRIIGFGTLLSEKRNGSSGNRIVVSVWDLRKKKENKDGTKTPACVQTFQIGFINFIQGACYSQGKLYILSSDYEKTNRSKVYAISLSGKKIEKVYQGFRTELKDNECEGVCIANRQLYVCNRYSLYRVCRIQN